MKKHIILLSIVMCILICMSSCSTIATNTTGNTGTSIINTELNTNDSEPIETLSGSDYPVQYIPAIYDYVINKENCLTVIKSTEELNSYCDNYKKYSFEGDSFFQAVKKYDKAFFENNLLIFVITADGSGSIEYRYKGYESINSENIICIDRIIPQCGTCDEAAKHIIIEFPKSENDSADFSVNINDIYENYED